jgi:putative salt-induced outer membrane protein YdiY
MKKTKFFYLAIAAAAAFSVSTAVRAQDAPVPVHPVSLWQGSVAAGATLTRGNSETFLGTLAGTLGKKWDQNELAFGTDMAYGTTTTETKVTNPGPPVTTTIVKHTDTTAETLHGFGQYNRLFNERLYGLGRIEGLHDGVADIDYRFSFSIGAGYYFIKTKQTQLSAELGPGYIVQRLGGKDDQYATLRLGEKFNQVLSDRSRLWQTAEFLPQVDDFNNYIVNFEIGVEADLNASKSMSLRVYLDDTYNNVPAAGRKKNDLKLVAAVAYKF